MVAVIAETAALMSSRRKAAADNEATMVAAVGSRSAPAPPQRAVQLVDPNEVNDLDRAAAASVPAESDTFCDVALTLGTPRMRH
jgi:hypothetical protein